MSRILITGSSGKIGKELVKLLGEHELLLIDKKTGDDLSTLGVKRKILTFDPETIFHLAAGFERTVESGNFFNENLDDNIRASCILTSSLAIPQTSKLKCFVFASSYLVYSTDNTPLLAECSYLEPRNLCGASKLYTEAESKFVIDKFHANARWISARIFRVYGEGGEEVISRWVEAKKRGEKVLLFNPENSFDFIHAKDVAEALYALAFSDANGIYNVGTGVSTTIKEVIDIIKPDYFQDKDKPQFNEFSCADISKISKYWKPKIDIKTGIEGMLNE